MKRTPFKKVKTKRGTFTGKRNPVNGPLILSKKDPQDHPEDYERVMAESKKRAVKELLGKISTEVGYVENLTETNLEPTQLYQYQQDWLNDRHKYRHCDKSRQIGQSYVFACEGLSKTQLLNIYTGIFVSYNQEEANEKIVYAKTLYDSIPHKYRKKLVVDRITALEFEGRAPNGRITKTRLISHPQREPRGKGFNTDVFLDEIAHYQWQEKVYVASVPIVTRGLGQLSLASSPLGRSGLHWDVGHDKEKYNMFSRHRVFWWNNPDFLNEDALRNIEDVKVMAPDMETEDRVFEFGNDAIIQAYNSMMIEDFCQEYEIEPMDDAISYYPSDLINQCTFESLIGYSYTEEGDLYGDNPKYMDPIYPGFKFKTYDSPEELSHAIFKGLVGKRLFAGFDVGRNENNSEIIILDEDPALDYMQSVRLILTMKKTEFRKQFNTIDKLFKILPIRMFNIDSTGIGSNIGEDLKKKFGSRITDLKFNSENKGEMATNLKLRMEDQTIAFPNDRDLKRQIHSVKRVVSSNSVVKYEVEKTRMHHGDKFWALALASIAGKPAEMLKLRLVTAHKSVVDNTGRILKQNNSRIFTGDPYGIASPNMIGGMKGMTSLTPPPKHISEFMI